MRRNRKPALFILCVTAFLGSLLMSAPGRATSAQAGETPALPPIAAVPAAPSKIFLPIILRAPTATPLPNDFGDRVIALVNQHRANNGCAALSKNTALTNAALGHSTDMAVNNYFSHTGSDGSDPGTRARNAGYNWSMWGENIAAALATPESVVTTWMNSKQGHREIILNCAYRDTGVGYYYLASSTYRHYWTQDFGAPR